MKIQFPSRSELPKLPTLQNVSNKFHSTKNAVVDKFQSNKWMNGESILDFAKENSAELGAIGAAAFVSTLAIYSIIPGSSDNVNGQNGTGVNGTGANLTKKVNETIEEFKDQINSGALDYISDFSSLTSPGTLTVGALAITIAGLWICCGPKKCVSNCATKVKNQFVETPAQKAQRAAAVQKAKDAQEFSDFSTLLNDTSKSPKDISDAIADLNIFDKPTDIRQNFYDEVAKASDQESVNSLVDENLTDKDCKFLKIAVEHYKNHDQGDAMLNSSLTTCLFKDVNCHSTSVSSNEVITRIIAALAPRTVEENKNEQKRKDTTVSPRVSPTTSPVHQGRHLSGGTTNDGSSSSTDGQNMLGNKNFGTGSTTEPLKLEDGGNDLESAPQNFDDHSEDDLSGAATTKDKLLD